MLLVRGARAILFPSLYEGFGLPVLEAMTMGVPVLTSTTSALPEVAGDAALKVDPYDVADIIRALLRLDKDEDLRRALAVAGPKRAAGFSTTAYAERLRSVYDRIASCASNGMPDLAASNSPGMQTFCSMPGHIAKRVGGESVFAFPQPSRSKPRQGIRS